MMSTEGSVPCVWFCNSRTLTLTEPSVPIPSCDSEVQCGVAVCQTRIRCCHSPFTFTMTWWQFLAVTKISNSPSTMFLIFQLSSQFNPLQYLPTSTTHFNQIWSVEHPFTMKHPDIRINENMIIQIWVAHYNLHHACWVYQTFVHDDPQNSVILHLHFPLTGLHKILRGS